MSLINLIKTHCLADAQAGDFTAVAATLNAQTVEVRNPKSWTMADLIGLVGPEGAALVGGTIQAAGVSNPIFAGAWLALNITGLQLHTDERQQMINGLAAAGNWLDQLRDTVKAAGVSYTSLAGSTVTAQQCESAYETAALDEQWSTLQNEVINPAASNRADLIAALKAVVETLEAG
jgi:hypothetical protein